MSNIRSLTKANDRVFLGVCGGIADHFGYTHRAFRIVFLLLSWLTIWLPGLVFYCILAFVMRAPIPSQASDAPDELVSARTLENQGDSHRIWPLVFLVQVLLSLVVAGASIYALSGNSALMDCLTSPNPSAAESVFWGVFTVSELFLLFASPFFFKRLGLVARIGFATAILNVLLSFLMRD